MLKGIIYSIIFLVLIACDSSKETSNKNEVNSYLDYSNSDSKISGGVKLIPINTPSGTFNVWTKRVGNNPDIKLLLLHGGPGATHEYFECFDSYLPHAEIEYYYYDQLESSYSDQPGDTTLWSIERYIDEVEQVRQALGMNANNFYLLGHSWGGILAIEYALKYPYNLKGVVISNMVPSIPDYINYATKVLGPELGEGVLEEIKALEAEGEFENKRYVELVTKYYYPKHILRMPLEEWPDPVNRAFNKLNYGLYLRMQGPSEFGVVGNAKLKDWDRKADLKNIEVPALSIGGKYDTMDPEQMKWMAEQMPNGKYLHCPNGSHMSMYDDQETYVNGLIDFIQDVHDGKAKK